MRILTWFGVAVCFSILTDGLLRPIAAQETGGAASQTGTIAGVVLDKSSGDPIIEAGVEVVGQGRSVRTDLDGKYSIKIAPGTYEIRFFAPLYQAVRIPRVTVKPGEVAKVDTNLGSAGQAGVEVVEVVAQADRAAEATQLLQRKKSAVVSDTISAEVIKKTPGQDAADVVQRAPAVTVKDEKYIFVRGLGERYSTAMLNGSRLPSTDPQRRVVPLDLFPADFLESMAVVKSYTPDLPGDFSGGLADLRLRDFPEKFTGAFGLATSGNTQSTAREFRTYQGAGPKDYFGFGKEFRRLPRGTPEDRDAVNGLPDAQRFDLARRFRNIWDAKSEVAPPNTGVNFQVGDSLGPFGFQVGGVYQNEYKHRNERQRQFRQGNTPEGTPVFVEQDDFAYDISTFQTKVGGVFTGAYKPVDNHKISLRSLINRNSYDETQEAIGTTVNLGAPDSRQLQTRLRYTEEQLIFSQLAGEHVFPWFSVDWRTAYSTTTQDEPDTRHLTYVRTASTPPAFAVDSSGGLRVFNELNEDLTDSGLDVTVPFKTRLPFTDFWSDLPAKFKFGPAYSYRNHDFTQRRFQFAPDPATQDLTLPAEDLFQPGNFAPGGAEFSEETLPSDTFDATQETAGAYGLFDLPLVRDRLRLVAGARVEYSLIRIHAFVDDDPVDERKKNVDVLPGVNLIFSPRDDMNVRVGYGRSVSRPEFRELSPVQYPAPRGLRPLVGNPDLVQAEIEGYDLRWEWFFSPLEIVSVSLFYKKLDQPIEQAIIEQASNVAESFFNAEEGEIRGVEVEGRKDLGFISPRLKNLSLLVNGTYAESEVQAPITARQQAQTSTDRELQGQAPFIVNAAIDYTHPKWGSARVLYNTTDRRISAAGAFGLPDIFEERRNQLDFVYLLPLKELVGVPLTAKLTAENILNDPIVFTQGPELQRRYSQGVKIGLGVSYSF